jgi:hypothetical protein
MEKMKVMRVTMTEKMAIRVEIVVIKDKENEDD